MTAGPAAPGLSFTTSAASGTEAIGARLGRTARPETSRSLRIFLSGELGAGKTTCVRGLLGALGARGAVRSPTYALLEYYELGPWAVLHADLYRLAGRSDLEGLGLGDYDRAGVLWLVEWPERGAGMLPPADLDLSLRVEGGDHRIDIQAVSRAGAAWCERLATEDGLVPDARSP